MIVIQDSEIRHTLWRGIYLELALPRVGNGVACIDSICI
jgi:hypothetical protein